MAEHFQSFIIFIPGVSATYGFSPTISLSAGTMRGSQKQPSFARDNRKAEGEQGLAAEREQQHEEDYKGLAVAPIHQLPSSSSLSHLPLPFQDQVRRRDRHLVDGFPVERAHLVHLRCKNHFEDICNGSLIPCLAVHLEVAVHAGVAEGVSAGRVHRLHEGLQADLAHQVLVHLLAVVVQVRLVVRVMLQVRKN